MLSTLKESISVSGQMICLLHPWEDPVPFRRVWCLFEMYTAIKLGANIIMVSCVGIANTSSYTYNAFRVPFPHTSTFHPRMRRASTRNSMKSQKQQCWCRQSTHARHKPRSRATVCASSRRSRTASAWRPSTPSCRSTLSGGCVVWQQRRCCRRVVW